MHKVLLGTGMLAVVLLSGCATTKSTKAKPLKSATASAMSLSECQNITVSAFGIPSKGKATALTGETFARDIAQRLKNDYGQIFDSVEFGESPRGVQKECLIKGDITKYKPGSRVARAVLIGLGAASLEGNVRVTDANSGNELLKAPFDKLWAWGGIAGASHGIEGMTNEAAAAVAATIAQAKGWKRKE